MSQPQVTQSPHSNIDELKEATERLLNLLNDPHPGQRSWRTMINNGINEISQFSAELPF